MRHLTIFLFLIAFFGYSALRAAGIVSVRPVHERLLLIHFDEGRIIFHGNGEVWNDDQVDVDPINLTAALLPGSYSLSSNDDANYATDRNPLNINRKTKPTEISGICDGWGNLPFYGVFGCLNAEGDRALEHWLYLELPENLTVGKSYTLTIAGSVDDQPSTITFTWDDESMHSEALHVNNLGYAPTATAKYGYLYHWAGDAGGVDFSAYADAPFYLVNQETGERDFTGTVTFRQDATALETNQQDTNETPNQNFLAASVWECDFSAFTGTGSYKLSVPGVGASFPFDLACNALRPAYTATTRALYHNRSGIAKTAPYTTFTRPADHNPALTPGFAGRLIYTDFTICEATNLNAAEADKPNWEAGARGALETTFGWYHDAGDWDGYASHLKIPTQLMLTYAYFPENFTDGELNIPGSGNGLPDILDEASWLMRFLQRLRAETEAKGWSTGGVGGARVMGDLWGTDAGPNDEGRGSWQDTDRDWYVSGEDPNNTFAYAGMAAQFANLLAEGGFTDPDGIDWSAEASSAYAWAEARYDANLDCHNLEMAEKKNYAAAALYQLTGQSNYHDAFRSSWADMNTTEALAEDAGFGAYVYLQLPEGQLDADVAGQARTNIENQGDFLLLTSASMRSARYGGNPWLPMLIGQGTTPMVFEGIMAYGMLRERNPTKAASYLEVLHTTADYFLGTNPLNMTWVTGLGERSPQQLFHLDSWYDGHDGFPAGFTPYGPWRRAPGFVNTGPWDIHWPESSLYPGIADWPGHERWFGQRTAPLSAEFTVHQNTVNCAALYGALSGAADCPENIVSNRPVTGAYDLGVRTYPNPTDGLIFLERVPERGLDLIRVFDLNGRMLRSFASMDSIDLRELPGGIYLLELQAEGGRQIEKIVIQ